MGTYDPLSFARWEQVAALLIIVVGFLGWKFISDMNKTLNKTKEIAENTEKSLHETNGGHNVKDQLNKLENSLLEVKAILGKVITKQDVMAVKVEETSEAIEKNKSAFKHMREHFKDPEYFTHAEGRHETHEGRLAKLENILDAIQRKLRIK